MIINVLTLICLMLFSLTTQGQYYENGKYGTNKSVTVYSAKYTTQPTKGLFNKKRAVVHHGQPFFGRRYKIIR
jgi:hypothetical protein